MQVEILHVCERGFKAKLSTNVKRHARHAKSRGGKLAQLCQDSVSLCHKFTAGNNVIHQPETQRFICIDQIASKNQFARLAFANYPRQENRGDRRKDAKLYLRLAEPRLLA